VFLDPFVVDFEDRDPSGETTVQHNRLR
jgi:hypothetical protein